MPVFSLPYILNIATLLLSFLLIAKTAINLIVAFWHAYHTPNALTVSKLTIEKIRPFVFIKLFANCLTVVFFPAYLVQLTTSAHYPPWVASLSYVTYQAIFLIMLIPGGYLSEIRSFKKILFITTLAEALIFMSFGLAKSIVVVFLLQAAFGCVIPLSSSAEYAYILHFSPLEKRNESLALYSNTLRGATLSGILFGGLIYKHIFAAGVFYCASLFMLLALIYLFFLVPSWISKNLETATTRLGTYSFTFVMRQIPQAFKSIAIIKTLFCVGFPLGLLDEGIILFSLPLFLAKLNFSHEHIGQMIILVSLGFFAANKTISHYIDRFYAERLAICLGLLGIAISLVCFLNSNYFSIGIGLLLIGIFRGFLVAPGIAYLSKIPEAETLGKNVSLSVYRLFQTIGNIVGPILFMSLWTFTHFSNLTYLIIAILFAISAIIIKIG